MFPENVDPNIFLGNNIPSLTLSKYASCAR